MKEALRKELGQIFREGRLQKEITLAEVKEMVGLSTYTIMRFEAGHNVKFDTYYNLCQALGWEPSVLLRMAELRLEKEN